MKLSTLTLAWLFLIPAFSSFAQDPGKGFEVWETNQYYFLQKQWLHTKVTRSADAAVGKFAAQFQDFEGILQIGKYDAKFDPQPISGRPDSITFYFKGDYVGVEVQIFNRNGELICSENLQIPGGANWQRYSRPLKYTGWALSPLKAFIRFTSVNSTLDELRLVRAGGAISFSEDFESWTQKSVELPKGWYLINSDGKNFPKKTDNSKVGEHAVLLQNILDSQSIYPASMQTIFPLLGKPGKVSLYLRVSNEENVQDTITLNVILLDVENNGIAIVGNTVSRANSLLYSLASFPFQYFDTSRPVMAIYQLSSMVWGDRGQTDSVLSEFYIDDLILDNQYSASIRELREGLIQTYPNPVNEFLVLDLDPDGVNAEGASYRIFDQQGGVILEGQIPENSTQINTSGLASGTYLVRVKTREGETAKLIQVVH